MTTIEMNKAMARGREVMAANCEVSAVNTWSDEARRAALMNRKSHTGLSASMDAERTSDHAAAMSRKAITKPSEWNHDEAARAHGQAAQMHSDAGRYHEGNLKEYHRDMENSHRASAGYHGNLRDHPELFRNLKAGEGMGTSVPAKYGK